MRSIPTSSGLFLLFTGSHRVCLVQLLSDSVCSFCSRCNRFTLESAPLTSCEPGNSIHIQGGHRLQLAPIEERGDDDDDDEIAYFTMR